MLDIVSPKSFRKDLEVAIKRGYDIDLLEEVVDKIARGEKLEEKYKDHQLKGNFKGYRECHILRDWLLIYKVNEKELVLYLLRTGTHSDLFD